MSRLLSAPSTVFMNVTNRCNLRCSHCLASSGAPLMDELDTAELLRLARHMGEIHVFKATITGGEPFVRDDLFLLLDELQRQRIVVAINTNGTLVDDEAARRLAAYRWLKTVNVSLDGSTAAIHDARRGAGAFDRALAGIGHLKRHGLPVHLSAIVSQLNKDDLEGIVRLAAELEVGSVGFAALEPMGRGAVDFAAATLSADERLAAGLLLARLAREHGGFVKSTFQEALGCYGAAPRPDAAPGHLLTCSAAWESCVVQADGTVSPCNFMWDVVCGNVRHEDLGEMWRSSPEMAEVRSLRDLTTEAIAGCRGCAHRVNCAGGCRAVARLVGEDWLAFSPGCFAANYDAFAAAGGVPGTS